jgi:small-conductance mechanosensitive channel
LDRPFELGDSIVIGEYKGKIEQIGLKTTRMKSETGEQLIFPNADLLQSRIRNFQRMKERRVMFGLSVVYGTRLGLLQEIPKLIRTQVESIALTRWERSHVSSLGESAIEIETVYWVQSAEYGVFMETHHQVLLGIYAQFLEQSIQIAHPTQTLFVKPGTMLDSMGSR